MRKSQECIEFTFEKKDFSEFSLWKSSYRKHVSIATNVNIASRENPLHRNLFTARNMIIPKSIRY